MSLKKSAGNIRKYLPWFIAIGMIFFTIGFVLSQVNQGAQLGSGSTVPNPGHPSEDILCNGCVKADDISNGIISDSHVNGNAGIFTYKINGANGWHFNINNVPLAPAWLTASSTSTPVTGMPSWDNAVVEMTCDPVQDGEITVYSGRQHIGTLNIWNNRLIKFVPGPSRWVYFANTTSAPTVEQTLYVRPAGSALQFQRIYIGGAGFQAESANWECIVKIVSKCQGQETCP